MVKQSTDKLDDILDKYHLTEDELTTSLDQLTRPKKNIGTVVNQYYDSEHFKFVVIADSHIGSKQAREDIFYDSYKTAKKNKCHAMYHAGDLIEGSSNREGHIFETSIFGVSNQLDRLCEIIGEFTIPFYYIKGNHDGWSMKKSNQGVDVAQYISTKVPNAKCLGDFVSDIIIDDSLKIRLSHQGSTAYALSYSGQKIINAADGGSKPNLWFNGHIHKSMFMFYRNINYFEAGCLQDQTAFMAEKGSPAMVGYWLIDLKYNKGGIKELTPKFFPYY